MERYCGEDASLPENRLAAPTASPEYYDDVDGEADSDLEGKNAADELLQHTVLKLRFTKLRNACRRAHVFIFSAMNDVVDFVFRRVLAPVAGAFSLMMRCGVLPRYPGFTLCMIS